MCQHVKKGLLEFRMDYLMNINLFVLYVICIILDNITLGVVEYLIVFSLFL